MVAPEWNKVEIAGPQLRPVTRVRTKARQGSAPIAEFLKTVFKGYPRT